MKDKLKKLKKRVEDSDFQVKEVKEIINSQLDLEVRTSFVEVNGLIRVVIQDPSINKDSKEVERIKDLLESKNFSFSFSDSQRRTSSVTGERESLTLLHFNERPEGRFSDISSKAELFEVLANELRNRLDRKVFSDKSSVEIELFDGERVDSVIDKVSNELLKLEGFRENRDPKSQFEVSLAGPKIIPLRLRKSEMTRKFSRSLKLFEIK